MMLMETFSELGSRNEIVKESRIKLKELMISSEKY